MKLLEQFIQSKTGKPETCEDGLIITDNYIGVIDGMTSKGSVLYDNKKPGRIAMELIKESVKKLSSDLSMDDALSYITDYIHCWYEKEGILENVTSDPELRCCSCLILVNIKRREIWFVGDSQALINGKYYCFSKKIDAVTTSLRSFLIETLLQQGETEDSLLRHDKARDMIQPILKQQMYMVNADSGSEWAFPLLNGFPVMKRHTQCIHLPAENVTVVLASDGYPRLFDTLKQSEEYLAETLKKDPLLYKDFKSTKTVTPGNVSFDDRTYVKFTI